MRAVDTNILIRLAAEDDPAQTELAFRELALGDLYVPLSVTMEIEWALRGALNWKRADVLRAFALFLTVDGLEFENREGVEWAVAAYAAGADFADMIHVVTSGYADVESLITFDGDFARNKRVAERLTVTLLR